jgi:hypothetical protein
MTLRTCLESETVATSLRGVRWDGSDMLYSEDPVLQSRCSVGGPRFQFEASLRSVAVIACVRALDMELIGRQRLRHCMLKRTTRSVSQFKSK